MLKAELFGSNKKYFDFDTVDLAISCQFKIRFTILAKYIFLDAKMTIK